MNLNELSVNVCRPVRALRGRPWNDVASCYVSFLDQMFFHDPRCERIKVSSYTSLMRGQRRCGGPCRKMQRERPRVLKAATSHTGPWLKAATSHADPLLQTPRALEATTPRPRLWRIADPWLKAATSHADPLLQTPRALEATTPRPRSLWRMSPRSAVARMKGSAIQISWRVWI